MVVAPEVEPPVKVMDATPEESVSAVPLDGVMVARVEVLNVTTALGTATPLASLRVALTVAEAPLEIEVTVAPVLGLVSTSVKVGVGGKVVTVVPPLLDVVLLAVPLPQPVRVTTVAASNNDTEKFEIFWRIE